MTTTETRPQKDSIEFFIHQHFASGLFGLLGFPNPVEEPVKFEQTMEERKLGIFHDENTGEFAICYKESEESIAPLFVLSTNAIVEQMHLSNPLRPIAKKFDGREADNGRDTDLFITLEEVIELNKAGHVLIVPSSDDLIHVYGIGNLANKVSDQMMEFGGAYYEDEPHASLYFCPAHNDMFITEDECDDTKAALEPLGMKLDVFPIMTYQDKDRGFVIECNGVESYPFTIMEEGNIYGQGLVVAI